jgi:hypothetical protein
VPYQAFDIACESSCVSSENGSRNGHKGRLRCFECHSFAICHQIPPTRPKRISSRPSSETRRETDRTTLTGARRTRFPTAPGHRKPRSPSSGFQTDRQAITSLPLFPRPVPPGTGTLFVWASRAAHSLPSPYPFPYPNVDAVAAALSGTETETGTETGTPQSHVNRDLRAMSRHARRTLILDTSSLRPSSC